MKATRSRSLEGASVALGLLVYFHCTAVAWSQEIQYFGLTNFDGFLQIGYKYREQERERSTAQNSSRLEEMELNQLLHLNLDGYSVHPRFLEYRIGADLAYLWQRDDIDNAPAENSSDFLTGGDFRLTLLKDHPYTISAYAGRSEVETDQLFSLSYTTPRITYGAAARFRKGPLPFTLRYDHSEVEGTGGASDLSESNDNYTLSTTYNLGKRSRGSIDANLYKVDQKSFDKGTEQRKVEFSNTTLLGKARNMRFDGRVRLSSRTGTVNTSKQFFSETLHWKHSNSFYTRYLMEFEQFEIGLNRTETRSGQFSLNHRLYNSLTTSMNLRSRTTNSDEQDAETTHAQWSESYTKKIGRLGTFSLSTSVFTQTLDLQPRDETIEVPDEALVLNGTIPVALAQIDVLVSSIRVTDSRGITPYFEGVDYTVSSIGNSVFIARLFLGNIADGDTVLVTYRYDAGLARVIRAQGGSLNAQFSKGDAFTLYGQMGQSRQRLVSGSPVDTLENSENQGYGMKASWRALDFGVDYEKRRATSTSYQSLSQWLSVSGLVLARTHAGAHVTHLVRDFLDSPEKVESWGVTSTLTSEITRHVGLKMNAEYKRMLMSPKDLESGNEAYGVRGTLYWRHRKLSAELRTLYSEVHQENESEKRTRIEFIVRRDF